MARPSIVGRNVKPYSIKLTQDQRIKLLRLGGPKWIREQIDKARPITAQEQS